MGFAGPAGVDGTGPGFPPFAWGAHVTLAAVKQ